MSLFCPKCIENGMPYLEHLLVRFERDKCNTCTVASVVIGEKKIEELIMSKRQTEEVGCGQDAMSQIQNHEKRKSIQLEIPDIDAICKEVLQEDTTKGYTSVGYQEEINGKDRIEIPEFQPTRGELKRLAEYYTHTCLEIEYFWFLYQQTGSYEIRMRPYASRRLKRIAEVIGENAVQGVIDKVYADFEKKVDPRLWAIFLHGSKEQWDEVAKEYEERLKKESLDSPGEVESPNEESVKNDS